MMCQLVYYSAAFALSIALCYCFANVEGAVITEVISGTIFRNANSLTVDKYYLEIAAEEAMVEFDILSMETADNITFIDVNNDCDSAYIDSHIYLFRQPNLNDPTNLVLEAYNDDEGDDGQAYYLQGRSDGSVSSQDSYLMRTLSKGNYVLSVGRYPLSLDSAKGGESIEVVHGYSPYTCQSKQGSYGNYQLTIRTQSTTNKGILRQYANSYIGNSCSVSSAITEECVFEMPVSNRDSILQVCSYDKTV